MEMIFCIDFTILTICVIFYIIFTIQQDYCNGIMNKYNELINNIGGGNYYDEKMTPVGGINDSENEPRVINEKIPENA